MINFQTFLDFVKYHRQKIYAVILVTSITVIVVVTLFWVSFAGRRCGVDGTWLC